MWFRDGRDVRSPRARNGNARLIDYFALALGHGLLIVAFLRLVSRDALDEEAIASEPETATAPAEPEPRKYRSGNRTRR